MAKRTMNQDIQDYPIYALTPSGRLIRITWINSTNDYNHQIMNLHHYIKRDKYYTNPKWYQDRGIEQKLILMSIPTHEQVEQIAVKNMSDKEFKKHYGISRWDLLFNQKHSKY